MSEETKNVETNDGSWSGLKKTIVGAAGTVVTAGGVWLSTLLGGNTEAPTEPVQVQQTAPAAPVVINLSNNNTNEQKQGGTTTIIKEKEVVREKEVEKKKDEAQDAPW